MALKDRFDSIAANGRLRIPLLFGTFEIGINELLNKKTIDDRLANLSQIRDDLEEAVRAVDNLKEEAQRRKEESDDLGKVVEKLKKDKEAAEVILTLPQEAVGRLIKKATSTGRTIGYIIGGVIGFITGFLSSLLVAYLMK